MASFERWCADQRQLGRLRHQSSVTVYTAMWLALTAWCAVQAPRRLRLQGLDAALLQRYLDSRSGMAGAGEALTLRYQLRLISLVRRVQSHALASADPLGLAMGAGPPAPAYQSAAGRAWSAAQLAATPGQAATVPETLAALAPGEVVLLIGWLTQPPPPTAGQARPDRWQNLRDRAALALQLAAGIGPGDLRGLTVQDVLRPVPSPGAPALGSLGWQLRVPANGNAPAYLAPVAAWAAPLLIQWLAERATQALSGPHLFPSTRSGKPWGKVAQYTSAQRCLQAAGLADRPGGSFRLRHSFALRQLAHGHAPDTVAGWLGVRDPAVMQRYQHALAARPAQPGPGAGVIGTPGPIDLIGLIGPTRFEAPRDAAPAPWPV